MNRFASSPAYLNGLPQTGQTTVYVAGDNGTNQTGVPHRYEVLTTGQYSGTTAIILNGKTDTHSNAVVIDHQYRLMYSQTLSASVGPTSNGLLPWTTNGNGEGVFTYAEAANTASLAGHTGWRVPSYIEFLAQQIYQAPTTLPNSTAFPSFPSGVVVATSTTQATNTANPMSKISNSGTDAVQAKTVTIRVLLVRSM